MGVYESRFVCTHLFKVMAIVGKIQTNFSVSRNVQKVFSRFLGKDGFDVIELFNASSPNDPSPPSKAAAVVHRSHAGAFTVIDYRVFDYNNRDFYRSQLSRILDRAGDQWLCDNTNGSVYTLHRPPGSLTDNTFLSMLNRYLNKSRNKCNLNNIAIFSKSLEVSRHRIFQIWNQFSYFVTEGDSTGGPPADAQVRLLGKSGLILHAIVEADESIRKYDYQQQMISLLKQEKCFEGILYFNKIPTIEKNFYHTLSITATQVGHLPNFSLDFIRF